METKLLTKSLLALLLVAGTTTWTTAAPSVTGLSAPGMVPWYEKYEIDFDLTSLPANPYDPDEYNVYALFTSPAGQVYKQFAFYCEGVNSSCVPAPYSWMHPDGLPPYDEVELLSLNGAKGWKVRFAAKETGTWTYRIVVDDNINQNSSITPAYSFSCTIDPDPIKHSPGFVEQANKRYFRFSSGAPFYPVGLNYPLYLRPDWRHEKEYGFCEVKKFMDIMALQGINFLRMIINIDQGITLIGYDYGTKKNYLRTINQLKASQLDEILEYAKTKKMYLLLDVLVSMSFAEMDWASCSWSHYNPFNSQLPLLQQPALPDSLGQCDAPYDFFVNPDARKVTKNFLQYFIAR